MPEHSANGASSHGTPTSNFLETLEFEDITTHDRNDTESGLRSQGDPFNKKPRNASKPRTAHPNTELNPLPEDERSLINQVKLQPYLEAAASIDSYSVKYRKAFWITLWTELLLFLTYAINISGFISGSLRLIYFSIIYTFLIYVGAVVAIVESVFRTRKHDREGLVSSGF